MPTTRGLGEHRNSLAGRGMTDAQLDTELRNRVAFDREQYLLEVWAKDGFVSVPGHALEA